jgi:type I restriction enzyme, S subunit
MTPGSTRSGAQQVLAPKLRFPEFRDVSGWQAVPLKSVCQMQAGRFVQASDISDRSKDGLFPCYGGNGLRGYTKTFTHSGKYPLIGRQGALCGNVKLATGDFHATEHAVVAIARSGIDVDWLFYTLELSNLNQYATGQAQPGLSVDVLNNVLIALPPEEREQQKIAECLSTLDDLIGAESKKLEALNAHKKGLVQQLFLREGETLPRLRFPEFQNAPEWEAKRLSTEIDLISGMHLSADQYSATGEVPYFTGPSDFTNEIESVTKWTKRSANMAERDDALITVKGSGVGEVWFSTLPAVAMGRQLMAVRVKRGSSRFIYQFLLTKKTRFEDLGAGNLIPGLSRADILEMNAHFPSPTEQQRISNCLSALDELIAAQSDKLSALNTHKQGLMQQLFPSPAEAEA